MESREELIARAKAKAEREDLIARAKAKAQGVMSPDKEPEMSGLEALGRGGAEWGTFGFSGEAAGGINALLDAYKKGTLSEFGTDYDKERAEYEKGNDLAWEQHPLLYGTGAAIGALGSGAGASKLLAKAGLAGFQGARAMTQAESIADTLSKAKGLAGLGGLAAAGASKARVLGTVPTISESNADDFRKQLGTFTKDVAFGAATAPGIGIATDVALPALTAAPGIGYDKAKDLLRRATGTTRFELSKNADKILAATDALGIPRENVPGYLLTDDIEAKRAADMILRSGRIGGSAARKEAEGIIENLRSGTSKILEDATSMSQTETGRKVQSGVQAGVESRMAPISEAYDELDRIFADKPVSDPSIRNVKKTLSELSSSPGLGGDAKKIAQEILSDIDNVKTIQDLRNVRTNLNGMLPFNPSVNQRRVVSEVGEALTRARDNSIGQANKTVSVDLTKAPLAKDTVPDLGAVDPFSWKRLISNSPTGDSITFSDPHIIVSSGKHHDLPSDTVRVIWGGGQSKDVTLASLGNFLKTIDPNGNVATEFADRFASRAGKAISTSEIPGKVWARALNEKGYLSIGDVATNGVHITAQYSEPGYVRVYRNVRGGTGEYEYENVRVDNLGRYLEGIDRNGSISSEIANSRPELIEQSKVPLTAQTEIQRSVLDKALDDPRFLPKGEKYRTKIGSFSFHKVSKYSQSPNAGKIKVDMDGRGTIGYVTPEELPAFVTKNDPEMTVAKDLRRFKYKIPSTITKDETATKLLRTADKAYSKVAQATSEALPYQTKRSQGAMEPVRRLMDEPPESVRRILNLFQSPERHEAFSKMFPDETEILRRAELARIKSATMPPQGEMQRQPGRVLQEIFGEPRGEARYQPEIRPKLLGSENFELAKNLRTVQQAMPQDYNPSHTASAATWLDSLLSPKESIGSMLGLKQLQLRSPQIPTPNAQDSIRFQRLESLFGGGVAPIGAGAAGRFITEKQAADDYLNRK